MMRAFLVCAILLIARVSTPVTFAAEPAVGGIGLALAVDKDAKAPKVLRVIPNSPAAKAGVSVGTVIRRIGDVDATGKSLADCVALIRGPVGSKLTLELLPPGETNPKQVELTREQLPAPVKARLGDPAAALTIKEWIQGDPVDVKAGKGLTVVEFWATWCGPCRVSIPHLNSLQKKLQEKGVRVVGISDEDPQLVKAFVKKMGSQMEYAIACDDTRQTYANYMEAYGYNGIPTAFVVDKNGRVIWHGHPMAGLDTALDRFLAEPKKP